MMALVQQGHDGRPTAPASFVQPYLVAHTAGEGAQRPTACHLSGELAGTLVVVEGCMVARSVDHSLDALSEHWPSKQVGKHTSTIGVITNSRIGHPFIGC